jgi:hypothetical protein
VKLHAINQINTFFTDFVAMRAMYVTITRPTKDEVEDENDEPINCNAMVARRQGTAPRLVVINLSTRAI